MRRALLIGMCLLWPGWFAGLGCSCYIPIKCLQDSDCDPGLACDRGDGQCRAVAGCKPNAQVRCNAQDGHLYWFDSCGKQGQQASQCPTGCAGDRCKSAQVCGMTCDGTCQCADGTYCIRGACRPCEQNSDCGTGNTCQAGRCVHQNSQCKVHTDCATRHVCDQGTCVLGVCTNDKECQAGRTCVRNQCEETNQTCGRAEDCTGGQVCFQGRCRACTQDSECARGLVCRKGGCSTQRTCKINADCGANFVCFQGICRPGSCAADRDCPSGGRCVNFGCQMGGCTKDTDCKSGEVCASGKCIVGCRDGATRCKGDAVESCNNNQWTSSWCPTGRKCANGVCLLFKCKTDQDCGSGEVCNGGGSCSKPSPCKDGESRCVSGGVQYCKAGAWGPVGKCKADETCEKGVCIKPKPKQCTKDSDCIPGTICDGGTYVCIHPPCASNQDCNSKLGETCQGGRCCDCDGSRPTECRGDLVPFPGKTAAEYRCVDKCRWYKSKECNPPACRPGKAVCGP